MNRWIDYWNKKISPGLRTIKFKLLLSYFGIAVIPIIFSGIIFYNVSIRTIEQNITDSTLNNLNSLKTVMDDRILQVESFMESFISSAKVNIILNKDFKGYNYIDTNTIITILNSLLDTTEMIDSVIVFSKKNDQIYKVGNALYINKADIINSHWYSQITSKNIEQNVYWIGVEKTKDPNGAALVSKINSFLDYSYIGMIYASIKTSNIYPAGTIPENSYIIDESNKILTHNNPELIGTYISESLIQDSLRNMSEGYYIQTVDNKPNLVVFTTSDITNWKLIQIFPVEDIHKEVIFLRKLFILAIFVILILVFILSLIFSRRISTPIKEITRIAKEVESGNLNVRIDNYSNDEVGQLAKSFNSMVINLQELIKKIFISEQKKKKIEIEVLQAQINPHFLYNTLGSIQWMATIHDVPAIRDMINSLIKLLKQGLSSKNTLIPLSDEMEALEQYMHILNVRFNNNISFSYKLPEVLQNTKIFRLLLQPLVENSIIHGIKPKGGIGSIEVICEEVEGFVEIQITDDGVGIPHKLLEAIEMEKKITETNEGEIGISNVRERIKLYFDPPCGIFVTSQEGKGTKIKVIIPKNIEIGDEI
jgi:two-component system, sensor histidine kinase YesM